MHEMSIAESIMDIVSDHAQQEPGSKVKEIELDIGNLSGIEIESLTFALDVCQQNLKWNAKININYILAKAVCIQCEHEFEMKQIFEACPKCQSYGAQLVCGKEMQVKSIVIE